jgi:hypothetical protein
VTTFSLVETETLVYFYQCQQYHIPQVSNREILEKFTKNISANCISKVVSVCVCVCVCNKIRLVTYTFLNLASALIISRKILISNVWRRRDTQAKCPLLFCAWFNGTVNIWVTWSQILEWRMSNELKRIFISSGKSASVCKMLPIFQRHEMSEMSYPKTA